MFEPLPDSNSTRNSDGQVFLAETLADALQAIRLYLGMDIAFITEFVHGRCVVSQRKPAVSLSPKVWNPKRNLKPCGSSM